MTDVTASVLAGMPNANGTPSGYQNSQPFGNQNTALQPGQMVGSGNYLGMVNQQGLGQAVSPIQAPDPTQFQGGSPMMIQGPQTPGYTNPFPAMGQIGVSGTGETPAWAQQSGMIDQGMFNSPGFQYALPNSGPIQGQVANTQLANQYYQPSQAAVHQVGAGDPYMQRMEQAYYDQARARLDPQWQQTQADLENQLSNMGITRGSEAWNRDMQNMQFGRNDAYQNAMNQAILNSGAEAQRYQGMNLASGNFANAAQQQDYLNQFLSQQNYNQAMGQQFNQGLQQGQFANAAQAQNFGQNLSQAQLNNQALAQQQAAAQGWGQLYAQTQLGNQNNALGYAGLQNQANMANQSTQSAYAQMMNQLSMANMQNQLGYAGLNQQGQQANLQAGLGYAGLQNAYDVAGINANANVAAANASAAGQMGAAGAAANASMSNNAANLALAQQNQNFNIARQMYFDPILTQNMLMQGMYPTGTGNIGIQNPIAAGYPGQPNYGQYANMMNQGNNMMYGSGGNLLSLGGNMLGIPGL